MRMPSSAESTDPSPSTAAMQDDDDDLVCAECREDLPKPTWCGSGRVRLLCCGKALCASCSEDLKIRQVRRIARESAELGIPLGSDRIREFVREKEACPLCHTKIAHADADLLQRIRVHADLGKPWALEMLGHRHRDGTGGAKKDLAAAFDCFRRAAEAGSPCAQHELAECYRFGRGTTVSMDDAAKWHERAAATGYALSQHKLGNIVNGMSGPISGPPDHARAFALLSAAAEQGYGPAQACVAYAYDRGHGVPPNLERSVFWTRRAAMQDICDAKGNLAARYLQLAAAEATDGRAEAAAMTAAPIALFWSRKGAAEEAADGEDSEFHATRLYRHLQSEATNKCAGCGVSKAVLPRPLLRCSRCKEARYCSVAHQKMHWKLHKRWCEEVKAANEEYEEARKK
jgi:MYND finger/Sel1 repeat